ncbi:hypothetical protein ACP4OV_027827 [Aristida adscensionis]
MTVLEGAHSNYATDFPVGFNFEPTCSLRRHLSANPADAPVTTQLCKKRKRTSYDLDVPSCSTNDGGCYPDPSYLDSRADEFFKMFESKIHELSDRDFKRNYGGSYNAYTCSETTNFYFDINVDNFEEALDRFAQFFIKPLMSQDAVLREIKAVDSEHKKNLLSDGWRIFQLQKHLASKDHPYHKFSMGSWKTLETKPKERGLDIRLELLKLYDSYSANLMHLVVYGKVERLFSDVKNTDQRSFKCPSYPLSEEHLQLLVKALPIEEGDYLRIIWPVTPNIQFYKEGPCRYLSHLIGHEGEGSIFHVIKELGWAMNLSAGEGTDSTQDSFFSVSMRLTDAGHEHMEDIRNVKSLIDSKLEKFKNLWEESHF